MEDPPIGESQLPSPSVILVVVCPIRIIVGITLIATTCMAFHPKVSFCERCTDCDNKTLWLCLIPEVCNTYSAKVEVKVGLMAVSAT